MVLGTEVVKAAHISVKSAINNAHISPMMSNPGKVVCHKPFYIGGIKGSNVVHNNLIVDSNSVAVNSKNIEITTSSGKVIVLNKVDTYMNTSTYVVF